MLDNLARGGRDGRQTAEDSQVNQRRDHPGGSIPATLFAPTGPPEFGTGRAGLGLGRLFVLVLRLPILASGDRYRGRGGRRRDVGNPWGGDRHHRGVSGQRPDPSPEGDRFDFDRRAGFEVDESVEVDGEGGRHPTEAAPDEWA